MKLIGIKYCGGCNPHIDRIKLAQTISKKLSSEFILTENQTKEKWNVGILICGCLTACADKPEFKNLTRKWIVVAGNSVDLENAPEEKLADIIVDRIMGMNPKASFGNKFRSKLRGIIPSALRDCSTCQFRNASLSELEFH